MGKLDYDTLAQIVGRSRQLCTPEGQKLISSYSGGAGSGSAGGFQEVHDKWDNWNFDDPDTMDGYQPMPAVQQASYQNRPMRFSENSVNKSGLPDSIKDIMLESMKQNYATESNAMEQLAKRISVNENMQHSQNQSNNNSIKAIIKECLDEYFGGGSLSQIGLFNGKIKIVDNKGNIYSAKLEKVGNVHDKKK